jgi:hypothetical protein
MEGDPTLSVFSEARQEYTKQLSQNLKQPYIRFFLDLLEQSKNEMKDTPKRFLWQFQTHLKEIRDWNMDKVQREISQIKSASGCDFLEELLTAIFIAHTKVLTSIRLSAKKKKINIVVPKLDHFLFRALIEGGDLLWSSAYLFRDDVAPIEKQQNMRQIEGLIQEGFQQAIRGMLPVKSILRDLVPDEEDEAEADAAEAAEVAVAETEVEVQGQVEAEPVVAAEKVEPVIVSTVEEVSVPVVPEELEGAARVLAAFADTPAMQEGGGAEDIKSVTSLPVSKKLVEITKVEDAGSAKEAEAEVPVFSVDTARKRVSFSEMDNVFQDDEDETDTFFTPTSQGTSELADGIAAFEILDDTAEPLGMDDCEELS